VVAKHTKEWFDVSQKHLKEEHDMLKEHVEQQNALLKRLFEVAQQEQIKQQGVLNERLENPVNDNQQVTYNCTVLNALQDLNIQEMVNQIVRKLISSLVM
jgi:ribosomal protein S3AE